MKKKLDHADEQQQHDLEIIKAVAQAWHAHSSSTSTPTSTTEFDARRLNFKSGPSRFLLEALAKSSSAAASNRSNGSGSWDFRQSLWDSYEILAVSRRLEAGNVLDYKFDAAEHGGGGRRRRRESMNSLRNIFNRSSSRRFDDRLRIE